MAVARRDPLRGHSALRGGTVSGEPVVPETIVSVAIVHDGTVWAMPRPARHHDVIALIRLAAPDTPPVSGGKAQGFMTSASRYVDRLEGGRIALAAGQTDRLRWGPRLFSEDLW